MEQLGLPVPSLLAVAFGGWSLALGLTWLFVRKYMAGDIIPRTWVDAMRTQDKVIEADLRSRLEDANEALRTERQQKELLLTELGATVTKTFRSLPKPGAGEQEAS